MKNVLGLLSAGAVCAFMTAAPAFAQDTVTGAPAGTAPATAEGYGYAPGQPGYGYNGAPANGYNNAPAYGNGWGPLGPVGAVVGGLFNPAGAMGAPGAVYATQPHAACGVIHDFNGRYTSVCGP
jgi:hypothetical protein